ncbi:MAG: hypothetical protein V3V01_13700 [Acidimicrobiales bacterium]
MTLFEDLRFEGMGGDGPTVGADTSAAGDANNAADNDGRSAGGGAGSDGDDASEGLGSVLEADMAFALVTGFLRTQPLVGALARILAYQASLSALEAELLAAHQASTGASDRETERLHEQRLTLYQQTDGHWRTRPATPQETPPPRPPNSDRGRSHPKRE